MRLRFGQSDPRLENSLVPEVTDRMREMCSEYPYWFLRVNPGDTIQADFPFPSTEPSGWKDRGWFITVDGQTSYALEAAVDLGVDEALIAPCEARELVSVKMYDLNGAFLGDLAVLTDNEFLSRGNQLGGSTSGVYRGYPTTAKLNTQPGQPSYIQLSPTPDRKFVLAVSWDLAYPPWFGYQGSATNLIMMVYPRLVECLIGIQYAEFFKEWEAKKAYEAEIWGDAGGKFGSAIPNSGIVGRMKKDTCERASQETGELEWHASSRGAIGRNGGYHRTPGDAYYVGPGNYP